MYYSEVQKDKIIDLIRQYSGLSAYEANLLFEDIIEILGE